MALHNAMSDYEMHVAREFLQQGQEYIWCIVDYGWNSQKGASDGFSV